MTARRFDWVATLLAALFTGGLYLDGWAHTHGRVDDTFLTPWHAVLYAGFLAFALLLIGRAAWGFRRAGGWRGAMPPGYGLGLIGVACWLVGGPFDALWHSIFGFEVSVEALMSPAHALLAVGACLMTAGPLRAGLRRAPGRWRDELPLVLSMAFVVSNLTFFTQIAHPASNLWATRYAPRSVDGLELGITGLLLTAVILTAPILLLVRWSRLPGGGTTIVIGLTTVAMGFLFDRGPYPHAAVLAMIVGAVLADVLRVVLRPCAAKPRAFRVFAVGQPMLLYATYFVVMGATSGLTWSPHLWLGVVVFAGLIGWLMSYVLLPPCVVPGVSA
jgi:hypothetical protein